MPTKKGQMPKDGTHIIAEGKFRPNNDDIPPWIVERASYYARPFKGTGLRHVVEYIYFEIYREVIKTMKDLQNTTITCPSCGTEITTAAEKED